MNKKKRLQVFADLLNSHEMQVAFHVIGQRGYERCVNFIREYDEYNYMRFEREITRNFLIPDFVENHEVVIQILRHVNLASASER